MENIYKFHCGRLERLIISSMGWDKYLQWREEFLIPNQFIMSYKQYFYMLMLKFSILK